MKKEKNRSRSGGLWGLLFISLLCVIIALILLCLLCLKIKNELRQEQQALVREQERLTEKIERLEAEIKVLDEKIPNRKHNRGLLRLRHRRNLDRMKICRFRNQKCLRILWKKMR